MTTEPESVEELPGSTFVLVGMWIALETFLLFITYGGNFKTVERPLLYGGIFASKLMVAAWLIFATESHFRTRAEVIRFRWFNAALTVGLIVTVLLLPLLDDGTVVAQVSAVHLLVMSTGFVVSFLLLRNYFRLRLTHRQRRKHETSNRSEVSIKKLLVITGILAIALGACRFWVGELDLETLLTVIVGCLLGLLWWATAIWMLGRRRYLFVTCAMFVVVQLFGVAVNLPDNSGNGDDVIASGSFVLGIQLHLLMFLAIMRASQFRFVQIGVKASEPIAPTGDPLLLE